MKILFIARRFPPSVGGMERFAFDLSNALDERVDLKKITYGGSNKWLPVVLPWFFVRAFFVLLIDRKIDIIHMQDAVQAPIGWLLHVIFRKPYVIVAHGLDITYKKAFYPQLILPFVRRADAVVSISSATNDEVLARSVVASKAIVVTLGVHDDYEGNPTPNKARLGELLGIDVVDKKSLLTTGRLVKRKGVAWFIENALPSIAAKNPEVLYLVAGDGAERETIEMAIERASMQSTVKLLGRVSDEARSLLYQSCDVFVMPNIVVPGDMEGFGIVVHEAATAGLPVVASDLEGIKDALRHNENGIMIPSKDTEAFVSNITELLSDDARRIEFGKHARAYTLREFSWQSIAAQYADVYAEVTKK